MYVSERLNSLVESHQRWRGHECLNLIPSENVTSPRVRELLASDLGHRYTSLEKFYKGTEYLDEVERIGEEVAKGIFNADFASLRPISGHTADMIVLSLFCSPGEKVITVDPSDGGYPGISDRGFPKHLGLKNIYFPFNIERMNIETEAASEVICREKPKIVFFGSSLFLFPHPVRELSKVCHETNSIIAYDGSHVMGLIGGGEFQDPFRDGADILLGSTHKSLFGPQGGIILSTKRLADTIWNGITPSLIDNAHWNRIAALAEAMLELSRSGREYAKRVIGNARALAKGLASSGLPVAGAIAGYTSSHQVYLRYDGFRSGSSYAEKLQHANIIVDSGIRLGTCEVTRYGMDEDDMVTIAELISRVLVGGEDPHSVKKDVIKFRRKFTEIRYT